ncbi:hypothetical protein I3760_05G151300 [Carya illinoinensis]|nr:hypothetical protein I3760_05G151300 [Carya illinoinensis]
MWQIGNVPFHSTSFSQFFFSFHSLPRCVSSLSQSLPLCVSSLPQELPLSILPRSCTSRRRPRVSSRLKHRRNLDGTIPPLEPAALCPSIDRWKSESQIAATFIFSHSVGLIFLNFPISPQFCSSQNQFALTLASFQLS